MNSNKFLCLPIKKQHTILVAAMKLFGVVGYKKASIANIAVEAGISKAMIFYYFGSKKILYLFLMDFAGDTIKKAIDEQFDGTINDFFDRIRLSSVIKMNALRRFPSLFSFLASMYFESDKEVIKEIKHYICEGEGYSNAFVVEKTDRSKFKDDVDPQLVLEILLNYSEGYVAKLSTCNSQDMDILMERFNLCLNLMKRHFYKEEYLVGKDA